MIPRQKPKSLSSVPAHPPSHLIETIPTLRVLFENELNSLLNFVHHGMYVKGQSRLRLTKWFREQARESLDHALDLGHVLHKEAAHISNYTVTPKACELDHTSPENVIDSIASHESAMVDQYAQLAQNARERGDLVMEAFAMNKVFEEFRHQIETSLMSRRF